VAAVDDLATRLAQVRRRVDDAARAAGRDPAEVGLLLAVKGQPLDVVRAAVGAGFRLLGHNRAQELLHAAPALVDLPHEMHFIGHLQSNKANQVLPWVRCIQSVDRAPLVARLDRAAGRASRTLDVFLQVNVAGEATKFGVAPPEALPLAYAVGACSHLRLRGLMTIGAHSPDPGRVRSSFEHLAELRDAVVASGAPGTGDARELSMGMSGDLEAAVAAGSTMVRVGTAAFGPREP
jgi:pyridoxal phosphate enzyme (YggS family)